MFLSITFKQSKYPHPGDRPEGKHFVFNEMENHKMNKQYSCNELGQCLLHVSYQRIFPRNSATPHTVALFPTIAFNNLLYSCRVSSSCNGFFNKNSLPKRMMSCPYVSRFGFSMTRCSNRCSVFIIIATTPVTQTDPLEL